MSSYFAVSLPGPQLSAGWYGKRIMVRMKFPTQHQQNHDKYGEKTVNKMGKDGEKQRKEGKS